MATDLSIAYQRAAQAALVGANPIEPLRLTVISCSMWPLLRRGDTICVQPLPSATARVGEVVVVRYGAELITHRLIAEAGGRWITRGDNAVLADAPIDASACVGRVSIIETGTGTIDLTQPRWAQLNDRVGGLSRASWHLQQTLHIAPTSSWWAIRLMWLMGLPWRVSIHGLVMRALNLSAN